MSKQELIKGLIIRLDSVLNESKQHILLRLVKKPVTTIARHLLYIYRNYLYNKTILTTKIKTFWGEKMFVTISPFTDIWVYGAYLNDPEIRLTKFIIKNVPDFIVFLDLGANLGYYSLLVAKVSKKSSVYSFEPSPDILYAIKRNKRDNIIVINQAVSDHNGFSNFYSRGLINSGVSTMDISSIVRSEIKNFKRFIVKTITLDSFCKTNHINPDLIKIDVEGSEEKVLLGAKNLLTKLKPIIAMEVWFTPFTKNYKNSLNILKKYGFKCFCILDSGDLKNVDYSNINDYFDTLKDRYKELNDPSNFDNLIFMK